MKKIYLLLFAFITVTLNAQKQYKCYHVQEFLWNSKTEKFDTPVERAEISKFELDAQKKNLQQIFEDGGAKSFPVKSETINKEQSITTYKVVSPSDGYTYLYKINSKLLIIELFQEKASTEILLKKYLYTD